MWQYNYELAPYSSELYHYGVKGMKWGKRKALPTSDLRNRYDAAKAAKKSAGKEFDKSYSKAYNKALSAYSPSKKHRQANEARWQKASDDADKYTKAASEFKQVKKERKQAIKDTHKELEKNASLGEKLTYNSATRKKAAKYIVDNNMSVSEAKSRANKEAMRNTAIYIAALGAVTAAQLYKMR